MYTVCVLYSSSSVIREAVHQKLTAKKRRCKLGVALAASYTLTEPSLLLKTIKIGVLGRLLAVFRVDNVVFFIDRADAWKEASLAKRILEYMVTAPYLRRYVYPPNVPDLRYAGVLPPLQLPTHGVGGPREGEIREALVLRPVRQGVVVEAGLSKPVLARTNKKYRRGQRVLIRIESLSPISVTLLQKTDIYSGFSVHIEESLTRLLRKYRDKYYVIATSRKGNTIDIENLRARSHSVCNKGVLVVFGSPSEGLFELAEHEGQRLTSLVDEVVNTVPGQGTLTVRVEEAVAATLAILNLFLD